MLFPTVQGFQRTSSVPWRRRLLCRFDSVANQAQCGQTPSGFFSLADDKTRTACPTPPHSSATTTTGLSSADGCYTCDGGYLKNTASSTCDFPSKGKYVDASGTEVTCNPITTLQGGATATWIRGAAATAELVPFPVVRVS